VGQTLRRGKPQQRSNVCHIYAALILDGLVLDHSLRIGDDSSFVGRVGLEPTTTRL